MRKISLLLIMAVICSCFSSVTPVLASNVNTAVREEEIGLLSELEIIAAPEEESEYLEVVTRADFAFYVARMLKLDEFGSSNTRYYTDVPMDHWGLSAINSLTEMGAINGYMGKFNPDDEITVDQAVKILACVLGYDVGTEYPLENDSRMLNLRKDLLKGIENKTGKILLCDAVTMLYNALLENVLEIQSSKGDYSLKREGETLLERVYNISLVEGVVTEVYGVSIDTESCGNLNVIRIGDEVFDNKLKENANKYLGREIFGFYYNDENTMVKELILAFKKDNVLDNEVVFGIEHLNGIDTASKKISYYDEEKGRDQSVSYSAKTVVIKNGKDVTANIDDSIKDLTNGTIEYVWGDDYAVLIIREYYNITVGFINTSTSYLYDEHDATKYLDFTDEAGVYKSIWNADGKSIEFSKVAAGDIVSVFKSEKYLEAHVSNKTLSGKIDKFISDEDKLFLNVGLEVYETDSDFINSEKRKNIKLNQEAILYFDIYDKIAHVAYISTDDFSFGYIIKSYLEEDSDPQTLMLKILTVNGDMTNLYCDEKVSVDGILEKTGNDQRTAIMQYNGKSDNVLIRYKLNEEGKIINIDTPYTSAKEVANDTLTVTGPKGDYYYTTYSMNLGKLILMDSATVFFAVPSVDKAETADESDYHVITKSNLVSTTTYPMEAYQGDKEVDTADVILLYDIFMGDTGKTELTSMFLVDKKVQVYDEQQSDVVEVVNGISEGVSVKHSAYEGYNLDDFNSGDLVVLKRNIKGKITGIDTKLYDFNSGTKKGAGSNWNSWGVTYGYPIKLKNNVLTLSNLAGGNAAELVDITGVPITVCDAREEKRVCRAGSDVDLLDAINSEGFVFVCRRYTKPHSIVVYLGL